MIGKTNPIVASKRWETCSKCEHLTKLTKQCKLCYCFMKLKIHVAEAKCPDIPSRWENGDKKNN